MFKQAKAQNSGNMIYIESRSYDTESQISKTRARTLGRVRILEDTLSLYSTGYEISNP